MQNFAMTICCLLSPLNHLSFYRLFEWQRRGKFLSEWVLRRSSWRIHTNRFNSNCNFLQQLYSATWTSKHGKIFLFGVFLPKKSIFNI